MGVTVYRSTDASAPVLNGTVGSLVALLDACLVTGYGAKVNAGWTKPFVGTNKAAFRNDTTLGTGMYLRIQDDAGGAGGAKEARVKGFEVMTTVDAGTGDYPTVAQSSFGVICRKSATADSTARPWVVIANNRLVYIMIQNGDSSTNWSITVAGDSKSYVTADPYRGMVIGQATENDSGTGVTIQTFPRIGIVAESFIAFQGHYMARLHNGIGTAVGFGKHSDVFKTGNAQVMGTGTMTYPAPVNNGVYYSPIYTQTTGVLRGELPGSWVPLHNRPLNNQDTFSGPGGKTFEVFNTYSSGQVFIETSDTWSM